MSSTRARRVGHRLLERIALGGLAVPARAGHARRAPALTARATSHRLSSPHALAELVEHALDLRGVVPVDRPHVEARGLEPRLDLLRALLRAHAVGLPVLVAVEDGQNVVEFLIDDEVQRLGDLPLTALPVADDAVHPLVHLVQTCRRGDPRRDRQSLPQRARRGIEEREALHRVRVAVEFRVPISQGLDVLGLEAPAVVRVLADHEAEFARRGVDDRDRVALGEHQTIRRGVVGVIGRIAHGREHQDRDDVPE